jgi:hypothetical protein
MMIMAAKLLASVSGRAVVMKPMSKNVSLSTVHETLRSYQLNRVTMLARTILLQLTAMVT